MKEEKLCRKCKLVKTFDNFYSDKRAKDGRYSTCKKCQKLFPSQSREYAKVYMREYRKTHVSAALERYKVNHKKRLATHQRVFVAVKAGKIVKKPCEVCGEVKVHGHHEDYSKPLSVVWLCPMHHRQLHSGIITLTNNHESSR